MSTLFSTDERLQADTRLYGDGICALSRFESLDFTLEFGLLGFAPFSIEKIRKHRGKQLFLQISS